MKKYYDIILSALKLVQENKVSKLELEKYLHSKVVFEEIYSSEDSLLTDAFFTILHYVFDEENITQQEITYLIECLEGERVHSFEQKMAAIQDCAR